MTVVVYQCDECKRNIYRKQNKIGVDIFGRCIITSGCAGKMIQTAVKPAHAVGHSTDPVVGLRDWTPRKLLFTHTQTFAKKTWSVQHNLNGIPIATVYVYADDGYTLVPATSASVDFPDGNTAVIVFPTAVSGVVQFMLRASVADQSITTLAEKSQVVQYDAEHFVLSQSRYLTNGAESFGELTVATRIITRDTPDFGFDPYQEIRLQPVYLSPATLEPLKTLPQLVLRAVNNTPVDTATSPWSGVTKVVVAGAQYIVRSVNIHYPEGSLTTLGIPEGSPVFFNVVDGDGNVVKKLLPGELLALLAESPFLAVDKVMGEFVDLSQISESTAPRQLVYNNLNWRFNPSLSTKTYPNIITV